jgi:hypothetical protein
MDIYYIAQLLFLYYITIIWFSSSSFMFTFHKTFTNDENNPDKLHRWSITSVIWMIDSILPSYMLRLIWWYILVHPEYHQDLSNMILSNSKPLHNILNKINEHYYLLTIESYNKIGHLFEALKNKKHILHEYILSFNKQKQ